MKSKFINLSKYLQSFFGIKFKYLKKVNFTPEKTLPVRTIEMEYYDGISGVIPNYRNTSKLFD